MCDGVGQSLHQVSLDSHHVNLVEGSWNDKLKFNVSLVKIVGYPLKYTKAVRCNNSNSIKVAHAGRIYAFLHFFLTFSQKQLNRSKREEYCLP